MSISDLFYPGNPQRREDLIRTHQTIVNCVQSDFKSANMLSEIVNKHCGSNLQPLEIREDRPFKETWELFEFRLREIQTILDKIDQKLKKKLHPEDYKKLRDAKDYPGDVFAPARIIMPLVDGVLLSMDAVVLAFRFIPMLARLLPTVAAFTARIACTTWALVGFGVAVLGVDAIISAIVGAVERDKLNTALGEHKELLAQIEPVSEQFKEAVIEIKLILNKTL